MQSQKNDGKRDEEEKNLTEPHTEKGLVLSIVAPMHNEDENIAEFYERTRKVLKAMNVTYELICVNDGSTDATLAELMEIRKRDPHVKIINFSRNFGKEAALTAGIDFSMGEAVIPIDADLQDPPELIPRLIAKWKEGYDVVYATREFREGDGWFKRWTASIFYRVINKIVALKIPNDTGDFRLMSRPMIDSLKKLRERNRVMKGLFQWVGFKQTAVLYTRHKRNAGKPKQTYWKLWNLAIEGITSFSQFPLKFAFYFGLLIIFFAFIYTLFIGIHTLFNGIFIPGYSALLALILFLGGFQLFIIGVLGEYVGRIYNEVKRRPLYIVRELIGFEQSLEKM